ncbi:type IV pilus assembly protein PilV [Collimonas sp. OK607]|uniref:type IV pilus modification protein PilV n=1 Tax=Collimonas sp. OK607 TaxID=1798194 RepID=UPI0008E2B6C1|nr:type IV pilus modification protein PilV [Collimonas sp. OK607]SFA84661.1 type IV pilus assembly protein PilV [Collimonas sp. OK607]
MSLAGNRAAMQSGIGMIEVMVAIVIMVFAVFALISMQIVALRYQKTAHLRSMSSQFSADLADRMRANIRGAHDGAYNLSQQTYPALGEPAPSCPDPGSCTSQELAAKDIHEWRTGLGDAMAGGWGEIAGSVADGFTVKVYFLDMLAAADGATPVARNCQPTAADPVLHRDVSCYAALVSP